MLGRLPLRLVGLIVVGATVGIGAGIVVLSFDGDTAQSITVRADGDVVSHENLEEALKDASERAGFDVVAPEDQPPGLKVRDILVHPQVQQPPGGGPSSFGLVTLQLEAGASRFLLDELRGAFNPVLSGDLLRDAVSGADVYYDETDTAVIYSMIARNRGFILSFPVEQALEREHAVRILQSFAAEIP